MTLQERRTLEAERLFLVARMAELPEAALLTRSSIGARLSQVEQILANSPTDEREPAAARLTFSGKPVVGTHGIFADFGMRAVNTFTDAVAAVAASLTAPLAAMGPIPNRLQNQMLITGVALGSFGFDLEEAGSGQLQLDEPSIVGTAIERTQKLLHFANTADDDGLADVASELDQRAIDKVRQFVSTLVENDAVCTLQYHGSVFQFRSLAQVSASLARLSRENLQETELELVGELQGVIPQRRTFQFKRYDTGEVLLGRVGPSIANVDALNSLLYARVVVRVSQTRAGHGRARNLLLQVTRDDDAAQLAFMSPGPLLPVK